VTAAYSGRSASSGGSGSNVPGRVAGAPPAATAAAAAAPIAAPPSLLDAAGAPARLFEAAAASFASARVLAPTLPRTSSRGDLDGDHPSPCLSSGPAAEAAPTPAAAPEQAACPLAAAAARVEAWADAGEEPDAAAWAALER
jgi:hypothetical protein